MAQAIIIGGEPREVSRQRLSKALDVELEWLAGEAQQKHRSLVSKIMKGTVQYVFLIQNLIHHKTGNLIIDACKKSGVKWDMVSGYGTAALTQSKLRLDAK